VCVLRFAGSIAADFLTTASIAQRGGARERESERAREKETEIERERERERENEPKTQRGRKRVRDSERGGVLWAGSIATDFLAACSTAGGERERARERERERESARARARARGRARKKEKEKEKEVVCDGLDVLPLIVSLLPLQQPHINTQTHTLLSSTSTAAVHASCARRTSTRHIKHINAL